jgi:hypothetical protein
MEVSMAATASGSQLKHLNRSGIFGKCALTLAVAAAIAACGTAGPSVAAAGSLGRLDLVSRSDGRTLPIYRGGGLDWVVGTPGQEYSVRVCNADARRVLAVISVDGVNVITGDTAAPSQSGYVLGAYECAEIGGWRKSMTHTAAFYFTELPDAYAARTGRPENVGVIGVALFPEKSRPIAWRERKSAANVDAARAEAPAPARQAADAAAEGAASASGAARRDEARAMPSAPLAKLGTGHGRSEVAPTRMVRFERASSTPAETLAIHYDRRENLIAMGILPPPAVARAPNPFPAWTPRFVPDPPR